MGKSKVDEIVDGLLRLSKRLLPKDDWAREKAEPMTGRVAQLAVYDLGKTYSRRLKLGPGFTVLDAGSEPPYHTISMTYDTMIALLSNELDWGRAWVEGKVEFAGPDYSVHASLWAKGFVRFRKYLEER